MDSMYIVFEIVILSLIIYLVGWPLVKSGHRSRWKQSSPESLETHKNGVLDTLNEIEFDYSMGKLTEVDYQELKARYEAMAIKFLAEEDNDLIAAENIDEEISAELKRLQSAKGGLEKHA